MSRRVIYPTVAAASPLTSRNSADSRALLPAADEPNPYLLNARENVIPELYDIPIGLVNRVVYGRRKPANGATTGEARPLSTPLTSAVVEPH